MEVPASMKTPHKSQIDKPLTPELISRICERKKAREQHFNDLLKSLAERSEQRKRR